MLILTRKIGETITIGENIFVKLITIKNGVARIGIEAPKDVRVDRSEIRRRIEQGGEEDDE